MSKVNLFFKLFLLWHLNIKLARIRIPLMVDGQLINCFQPNYTIADTKALALYNNTILQYTKNNQFVQYEYFPTNEQHRFYLSQGVGQSLQSKFPELVDNQDFERILYGFVDGSTTFVMHRSDIERKIAYVFNQRMAANRQVVFSTLEGEFEKREYDYFHENLVKIFPINDPSANFYIVQDDLFRLFKNASLSIYDFRGFVYFTGKNQLTIRKKRSSISTDQNPSDFFRTIRLIFVANEFLYFVSDKNVLVAKNEIELTEHGLELVKNNVELNFEVFDIDNVISCHPNPNNPNRPFSVSEFLLKYKIVFILILTSLLLACILIIWFTFQTKNMFNRLFKSNSARKNKSPYKKKYRKDNRKRYEYERSSYSSEFF